MLFRLFALAVFFSLPSLQAADTPAKKPAKREEVAPAAAPGKLVQKLQTTWDGVRSYQATFKQTIYDKRLGVPEESQGTLYVSKPNKLRWESKTDGAIQIMNDQKLIVVQKHKRRQTVEVDIYPNLGKVMDPTPLNFLSGKAKFRDLYNISLVSEGVEIAELKFTPKSDPAETLVAEIDKNSYFLRSLTSETIDSRVRTEFTSTRTNVKLDDKLFDYKPKSSDIVHNHK